MIERESLNSKYVPEKILEQYTVSEAHVAKLGFLCLELNESHIERLFKDDENHKAAIDIFVDELYAKLSASPHVMDIEPNKEDLFDDYEQGEFGIAILSHRNSMRLGRFLKMRVVMPKRKREELGMFSWSWNPEEFTVYFDGSMFCVYAPIESIPIATDLGQITRDFLKETLSGSEIWELIEGIGPTPIHPELYFVIVKPNEGNKEPEIQLPVIKTYRNDICIFISEDKTLESITRPLFRDMIFGLHMFYSQRLANSRLRNEVDKLENMNEGLSTLVSQYFELPVHKRLFSTTPSDIRRLIAKMHMSLQQVSSAVIETQRSKEDAFKAIQDTTFLKGVESYFMEHMESDEDVDRDTQLSIMNFAAGETSNFDIIRTTLIAALSGALIGGMITAGAQYLLK